MTQLFSPLLYDFEKIICFFKFIDYLCDTKMIEHNIKSLYDMKTYTYALRPVTDLRDIVLYYEFVRREDDAILRSSADYDFLLGYAEGYTAARNQTFIVE